MIDRAARRPDTFVFLLLSAAVSFLLFSCDVKNYPKGRPFVYQTTVHIDGKYSTDEKKQLKTDMDNQLHDSIVPRRKRVFFIPQLKNPPVYDTANISRSVTFMEAQLNALGYYRDSIYSRTRIDTVGDQLRTYIDFHVTPGTLITMDSVWYNLLDSVERTPALDTLQKLTDSAPELRLLRKGVPFSKPLISGELDRLTNIYRNNGFLLFSREQMLAVWDTVGLNILTPTLDFEEQLKQLEALRLRRLNPVADVEIRLALTPDSLSLRRYYVGNVKIFPDDNLTRDTTGLVPSVVSLERRGNYYQVISYTDMFIPRKLIKFVSLRHGDLYRQSNYIKTLNRFNLLGSWRTAAIAQIPRTGTDTVDFEIRLTPAKKFKAGVNVDLSRNQQNLGIEGSLIGVGGNFNLINRNFLRAANQSTLSARYGVELATKIDNIQTQQFTVGYSIQFPRFVPRFNFVSPEIRDNAKSFLAFNVARTDRVQYFKVSTFNTSFGWEFNRDKSLIRITFPNIEYNFLSADTLLRALIANNKSYQYIFNDGLIVSASLSGQYAFGKKDITNTLRWSFEGAGLLGLIKLVNNSAKAYRFVKLDAEYVHAKKVRRMAFVSRAFFGIGKTLPFPESINNDKPDSLNYYLPFFRQYYAGGPNSMRAWGVRKLGPGSALKSFGKTQYPDRFGDMRIELNTEWRFFLANLVNYPLEGALFIDMGNIWFLRSNPDFPENSTFQGSRLWKDIAIGTGFGLRMDFSFLKIRADFAYKAKNPSPENALEQNKWFYKWRPRIGDISKDGVLKKQGAQFQLGINYPF